MKLFAEETRAKRAGQLVAASILFLMLAFVATNGVRASASYTLGITITTGDSPAGIAINTANGKIYVADLEDNNVTVIDGATNVPSVNVTIGYNAEPAAVAVDPTTGTYYVADSSSDNVTVMSSSNAILENLSVGLDPIAVAYDPVTNDVYVANYLSSNITVISASTNQIVGNLTCGDTPQAIAVNTVTGTIYVADAADDNVTVINTAGQQVANVTVGTEPYSIAVDSLTGNVYVANVYGGPDISVISNATNTVTGSLGSGYGPDGVAVLSSPTSPTLYVADSLDDNVTVVNLSTGAEVVNLTVGQDPVAVAVNPSTGEAYVVNEYSSTLSVIQGPAVTSQTTTTSSGQPTSTTTSSSTPTTTTTTSSSSSGIPEFPLQLGLAFGVTAAIVVSYVAARRVSNARS